MKKRMMSVLLMLCMLVSIISAVPITASAATSGKCGDNLTWTLDNNGTLTISGTGDMTSRPWDSYERSIKSVIINYGVTSIGSFTFGCCSNLTSVSIPNSVTNIGDAAFIDCYSLTSISIPDGITYLGDQIFSGCTKLTRINLPSSVIDIWINTFDNCSSLKDVYYSGSPEQWKKISIQDGNSYLTNATIHYAFNAAGAVTAPKVTTNENYSGGNSLIEKSQIDVNNLFSNISVGTDKIKGPKISILGKDFYLFQLDGKCSLKFGDVKIQLKVDEKKNSVQILGG